MPAYQAFALVAGRLLLSVIYLVSGLEKLTDPSGTVSSITSVGMPMPWAAYAVSIVCELGGGAAVLLGFYARLAATVLAVFTVVAALFFHTQFSDPDQVIHFMKNMAITGGFLCLAAAGPGKFSFDAAASVRRTRRFSLR